MFLSQHELELEQSFVRKNVTDCFTQLIFLIIHGEHNQARDYAVAMMQIIEHDYETRIDPQLAQDAPEGA